MAKIKVFGTTYSIVSDYSTETIREIKKFDPSILTLTNEKGEPFFKVDLARNDSISPYGISFSCDDLNNKACITKPIPCDLTTETVKKWLTDKYGLALIRLTEVESYIAEEMDVLNDTKATIAGAIEIVG